MANQTTLELLEEIFEEAEVAIEEESAVELNEVGMTVVGILQIGPEILASTLGETTEEDLRKIFEATAIVSKYIHEVLEKRANKD